MPVMPDYLLDACALIAIYNNEPGRDAVENLLDKAERGEIRLAIHAAQLVEVLYDRIRVDGLERTGELARLIYETYPVTVIEPLDRDIVLEAARLKSTGSMSFADTMLVATAACTGMTIVTSDWTELEPIARQGNIPFLWLRPKP